MKKYFVDDEIKQINLFDERFYLIDNKDVFNVTGWLEAFPKGMGFKKWLINTKDPDAIRDEAAQRGTDIHTLIERTLTNETVRWSETEKIDVWECFLGWCNFWKELMDDPDKTLKMKNIKTIETVEKFTEFITYDLDLGYAGTVDKMIKIIFKDDTFKYAILDWKSGANIYATAYIQISAYAHSVKKQYDIEMPLGFVVDVNPTLNKKGYRIHEVDVEGEFEFFLASQKNYIRAFGQPKPKYRSYPTEININSLKIVEVK